MKKIYVSILAAGLLFSACNTAPKGESAEVSEEETLSTATPDGEAYTITDGSTISFEGATPSHTQNGSFSISEGALYVKEDALTGGSVTVALPDMEITTKDLPAEEKEKLKGHLMGEDFFHASDHPNVKFEITGVEALEGDEKNTHTITGNLDMNGKANSISFPANLEMGDGKIGARAEFVINRKDWGMVYGNDESLKDKWIYDEVKMTLAIDAAK